MCNRSQGFYGSNNTLSPVAQTVKDAVLKQWKRPAAHAHAWPLELPVVISVLRALANHQQAPIALGVPIDHWDPDSRTRRELRNLADELEGADG